MIYDAAPKQYDPLKILNMLPMEETPGDEFEYKQKVFSREALTVYGWNSSTGVITLSGTYATRGDLHVQVDDVIMKSGTPYIVTAVSHSASANSSTITVAVQTGATALGAGTFAQNDILNIQGPLIADGNDTFRDPDRVRTVAFYNFIQFFQRTQRWTPVEMQKMINLGTTNIMDLEKNEKLDQLRYDLFVSLFAGKRGEFTVTSGTNNLYAKTMNGIYPSLVDGSAQHSSPSLSGMISAFETLLFATNHKAAGGIRHAFATDEILYELSKAYKETGTRYTPNDKIADLNLMKYRVGTMEVVPVPCDLFRADGVMGTEWENRMLVLDLNAIKRKKMRGFPAEKMGQTLNKDKGAYQDYTYWWVWAQMSLQFNDVGGSFYMDIS